MKLMRQHATHPRRRPCSGSLLIEVSLALGLTVMLALVMMKASLLAISGNQWTVMQTLTDAYLTRETALSNRIPWVDLTATGSPWPSMDASVDQTITLGKAAGGSLIKATLTRFRLDIASDASTETNLSVIRLYSVLKYEIGDQHYVKSRSTLRMQ